MTARDDERERDERRRRALAQVEWSPDRWRRTVWKAGTAIYVPEVDPR